MIETEAISILLYYYSMTDRNIYEPYFKDRKTLMPEVLVVVLVRIGFQRK